MKERAAKGFSYPILGWSYLISSLPDFPSRLPLLHFFLHKPLFLFEKEYRTTSFFVSGRSEFQPQTNQRRNHRQVSLQVLSKFEPINLPNRVFTSRFK